MSELRTFFLALALSALTGLLFFVDLKLPLGVSAGTSYVAVVLLAAWLPHSRLILWFAALCTTLTVAGFFWSPPGGVLWMALANRGLAILAIWTIAVFSSLRRQAEEKLQRANRELDAFVRTVSHDLRSPLTPIIGYADFLQEEYRHCLQEVGSTAASEIEKQGRRMLAMLEDLLQLARTGSLERPPAPVDVAEVVRGVLRNRREEAARAGMELRCGPLPEVAVPESLLAQIFDNLVGNAIRYAGSAGLIEIGGEAAGSKARYFVRDHGVGIPPEEGEKIFEAFRRGSNAHSIPGTGIGLATVQKIAGHFGGRAWVEETPGGGSTFWVEMSDCHRC